MDKACFGRSTKADRTLNITSITAGPNSIRVFR